MDREVLLLAVSITHLSGVTREGQDSKYDRAMRFHGGVDGVWIGIENSREVFHYLRSFIRDRFSSFMRM